MLISKPFGHWIVKQVTSDLFVFKFSLANVSSLSVSCFNSFIRLTNPPILWRDYKPAFLAMIDGHKLTLTFLQRFVGRLLWCEIGSQLSHQHHEWGVVSFLLSKHFV